MTRFSLYFDEHIQFALKEALEARGVDVLTTQQAGNIGLEDIDQLIFAARNGRPLLLIINETLLSFIMSGWLPRNLMPELFYRINYQ